MKSIARFIESFHFIATSMLVNGCAVLSSVASMLVLSPAARGEYVLAALVGAILAAGLDFGIGVSAVRARSARRDHDRVIAALDWLVLGRIVLILIVAAVVYCFGVSSRGVSWAEIMAAGTLSAVPVLALSSYTPMSLLKTSSKQYNMILLAQAIIPVAVFSFFLFSNKKSVVQLFLYIFFLNSLLAIWVHSLCSSQRYKRRSANLNDIRQLFSEGAPIGYTYLMNVLVSRGWYFLLSANVGVAVVGIFSFAHSIAERLTLIGDGFGQSLFKRSLNHNRFSLAQAFHEHVSQAVIFIIIALSAVVILASFIFRWLPDGYRDGESMLKWLVVPAGLLAIYRVYHHMLISLGKANESFRAYLMSGVTLIVVLLALPVAVGWLAGVIAFSIANIMLLALGMRALSGHMKTTNPSKVDGGQ
jgi:O-antigen/teichoic acid export membrane protein